MKAHFLATALLAAATLTAAAAGKETVTESVKIDAPPAKVWARIGHFGDLSWHPAIKKSEASNGEAQDSQRRLDLGGPALWEALISHSDAERKYTYRILDNAENQKLLPVSHYVATIEVKPSGQGSEVVWVGTFEPAAGATAEAAKKAIAGVYRGGLDNLAKALATN
ncbi:SRPBCC family protein [uncultured Rhodoblastus sp.]|uniref:SRPBCC family protein n=1 Tax=uncultured Rhodoblastus sp. TaxID=543037 RepID=UPI0025D7CC46|nr:SRPBCC family protein [uncultured Rhodoblastus sp.]